MKYTQKILFKQTLKNGNINIKTNIHRINANEPPFKLGQSSEKTSQNQTLNK